MALNLDAMTTEEKLAAMEALWDDLCRRAPDFSSPDWHGEVLRDREERLAKGQDRFLDWDRAKQDLRDSIQ